VYSFGSERQEGRVGKRERGDRQRERERGKERNSL